MYGFLGALINQRQIFLDEGASHRMFANIVQAAAPQTNLPTEDSAVFIYFKPYTEFGIFVFINRFISSF